MATAVDILLPVYNGADHLDRALVSLSAQTFRDLRILISDNASTDATPAIIEAWKAKDPRITSFRQAQNIGAVANFRWVLEQAAAPFAMFACHDDAWSPNYVDELYRVLQADPCLHLAAPRMVLIRPDGSHDPRPFNEGLNGARGLRRAVLSVLRINSGWFYGLYRRETLREVWNTAQSFEYAWGGDFIGPLPLLLEGKVTGSNAAIYYKQETPMSAARYRPKTLPDQLLFYRRFLQKCLMLLLSTHTHFWRKLVLLPLILLYTERHGWKLRRLIFAALGLKKY